MSFIRLRLVSFSLNVLTFVCHYIILLTPTRRCRRFYQIIKSFVTFLYRNHRRQTPVTFVCRNQTLQQRLLEPEALFINPDPLV